MQGQEQVAPHPREHVAGARWEMCRRTMMLSVANDEDEVDEARDFRNRT